MLRYFFRALGSHFRAGRALYVLTVLGVALGVASALCIQILNRNAVGAFSGGLRAVSGDADLSITGHAPLLAEERLPTVLGTRGVGAAWPLYRLDVAVVGAQDLFLDVVGFDFYAPVGLPWSDPAFEPAQAMVREGWVALTPELADERGWQVGDTFEVTSGTRTARLEVGALVDFRRLSPLASRKLALMDIAQAQSRLGDVGSIHQIDVRLAEGFERDAVAAALRERLGPGVQVLAPEQRERRTEDLLAAFRLNLTALSLISLLVGMFLIYSSTYASLVRRRSELGLLRSVGATRSQVTALILAEVVLLAAVGVLLGIPLGYQAAQGQVEVVSATLTNVYVLDEIDTLQVPPWLLVLAALTGLGGALGGTVSPALDMSRRPPLELLASYTLEESGRRHLGRGVAGAGALLAGATAWFFTLGRGWQPAGFGLAVALLAAVPLLVPGLIAHSYGRLPIRSFGLGFSLRGLSSRLRNTSVATSALAIAVSMMVGITVMIGSFRTTLTVWVDGAVRADVYVSTPSWRRGTPESTLPPEVIAAVTGRPEVEVVDRLRRFLVYTGDRRIVLSGVEMDLPGGEVRFPLLAGDPDTALSAAHAEGAVLIGEPLARKEGLGVGDRLPIEGPGGRVELPIAGVYYDYASESGTAAIDLRTFERLFGPGGFHSLALYLVPGHDPERTVDAILSDLDDVPLVVRSNRGLRDEVFAIFEETFAVTRILQTMSLLVAACGITLTLLVMARERLPELALYRALGARRRQLFRLFVGQGLGIALLGVAVGAAAGVLLAFILIYEINPAFFGWTLRLDWPWRALGLQCLTIFAAAVAASLYPAARASRTPASELSRER